MKRALFAMAVAILAIGACGDDEDEGGPVDAAKDMAIGTDTADGAAPDAAADVATADASDAAAPSDTMGQTLDRPPSPDLGAVTGERIFVYAGGDKGIDLLQMDATSGALTQRSWVGTNPPGFRNASFITVDSKQRTLYAVSEHSGSPGKVMAFGIDTATGALNALNDQDTGGEGAVHVSLDPMDRWVLVANYNTGMTGIAVFPVETGGRLGRMAGLPLAAGTNPHAIYTDPSARAVFVPAIGSESVFQYKFDDKTGVLTPTAPTAMAAAGTGPRHLSFSKDGKFAYLLNERALTIQVHAVDAANGKLVEPAIQTLSSVPDDKKPDGTTARGRAAEILTHPSGKFLYTTTRIDMGTGMTNPTTGRPIFNAGALPGHLGAYTIGADGKLTAVGFVTTPIEPRGMALDPDGKWVVVSGVSAPAENVTSYKINETTGAVTRAAAIQVPQRPNIVAVVRYR